MYNICLLQEYSLLDVLSWWCISILLERITQLSHISLSFLSLWECSTHSLRFVDNVLIQMDRCGLDLLSFQKYYLTKYIEFRPVISFHAPAAQDAFNVQFTVSLPVDFVEAVTEANFIFLSSILSL